VETTQNSPYLIYNYRTKKAV